MSEYQYYEFQAIDRPLNEDEMDALRSLSTRAQITASSFINTYEWGDFKGNPSELMHKLFDAHLYLANWGTHIFMLRLPRQFLDDKTVSMYCCGESASSQAKGNHIVLDFRSEEEPDGDWVDGEGWLSSLVSLRSDLLAGDHRVLYLGWVLCAQMGELDNDDAEPPVPPGLGNLTASMKSFSDFLRIDPDLIEVAAEHSMPNNVAGTQEKDLEKWIGSLSEEKKNSIILRMALGNERHPQAELIRLFRKDQISEKKTGSNDPKRRTVQQLLKATEKKREERERREAELRERERERRQREEAIARKQYLDQISKREKSVWRDIDELVKTKRPRDYDQAVKLLKDLRDLKIRQDRSGEFEEKLQILRANNLQKPSLLKRLSESGLKGELTLLKGV